MSSRARLVLIVGITVLAIGVSVAWSITRFRAWHEQGWAGVFYAPSFNLKEQQRGEIRTPQKPGEVVMTYANSPADTAFRIGDRIISINGIPIEDSTKLRPLSERLRRGAVLHYRVDRGGKHIVIPIRLASPFRSPIIVARSIVAYIVAGTFLFVALLVFLRRPNDSQAVVFYAFAVVTAVAILLGVSTLYEQSGGNGVIVNFGVSAFASILIMAMSLAYAPLILHLALIFPRERPIVLRRPYLLRWIYSGAAITAAMLISIGLIYLQFFKDPAAAIASNSTFDRTIERVILTIVLGGPLLALHIIWSGRREGVIPAFAHRPVRSVVALFGILLGVTTVIGHYGSRLVAIIAGMSTMFVPLIVISLYPLFACVALVRSYRAAGVEERRQVQWPLWGLLIALMTKIASVGVQAGIGIASSITHMSMMPWRGVFDFLSIVPLLVTLVIPISFAFAIFKYRLMNIDLIIRKTVVYAILSTLIIVVYLGLVGGLGTLLVRVAGLRNQTMVIASTLVVALLFVPLRNKLQTLVDRNLFRHRYDYPDALRAISAETRTAHDVHEMLASVAEKLQQALQNRAIVVFLERQGDFVASAKVGVSDAILGRLRVPHDFAPLLDRPFDPRRRTMPESAAAALSRIDAALIVPIGMPIAGRGFIAAGPKLSGGALEIEDVDFLRSAADEIAAALDRIRMQAEEVDYAQAREIQQTLLPGEMPSVAGLEVSGVWQPARTMGGDYYDLLKLSESELAICIGDVAGKGMSAALTMSGLQAAVRASASDSPRDLCERVRRVVVSSLSGGRFVTFFYATLDTAAMRLRWCNAGHNAPILARADGTLFRLSDGGPAISRLFRGTPYVERELALVQGDRIVLFTDGVSEVMDANGEMFGETRVEEIVASNRSASAPELQQKIVDAASAFGGGELEDDLTLVVVVLS